MDEPLCHMKTIKDEGFGVGKQNIQPVTCDVSFVSPVFDSA